MPKNLVSPAGEQGTKIGSIQGNEGVNSLYNNGSSFVFNFENFHKSEVYHDVVAHPWTSIGECQDRLGYYDGQPKNLRHRRMISDVFEVFVFFKIFRKEGHRFIATSKVPRLSSSTHQERKFNKDGLPITTATSTATMPAYPRDEI